MALTTVALAAWTHAGEVLNVRGGMPNFCRALKAKQRVRIVYLGGGITQGRGASGGGRCYRSLLTKHLRKQFPKCSLAEYNKSIPGTGSWLAAFRTTKDVLRHYIPLGLVVIEFAVDDAGEPDERVCASLEGVVRQIRKVRPTADMLLLYALSKESMAAIRKGKTPDAIRWHERIAEHYGVPSVNMAQFVAAKIMKGELAFGDFSTDGTHPTDKGHALYLKAISLLIAECKATAPAQGAGSIKHPLPKPFSQRVMDKGALVSYERASREEGWLKWQESPVPRFLHVVECTQPGPAIALRFVGDTVGYFDALGPDGGDLEVSVDGGPWQLKRRFDEEAKQGYRLHAQLLAEGLDPKMTHEVKLRVAAKAPAGSKGQAARLGAFLVNGKAVYDNPYRGKSAIQVIDAIYSTIEPVKYVAPSDRWAHLPKTMERLQTGGELRIVMLGDSIVNDTAGSNYEHLLMRLYPKCGIKKIRSVRGSTGCWWYKEDNRVKKYVLDHNPHLLMIGGISQRRDVDSIRDTIRQVRAGQPNIETMAMTGAFGRVDPRKDEAWSYDVPADGESYRTRLMKMAAEEKVEFLDLTGPWGQYIRDSKYAMGAFKRDPIHANQRGKQILGRILEAYFAPKTVSAPSRAEEQPAVK